MVNKPNGVDFWNTRYMPTSPYPPLGGHGHGGDASTVTGSVEEQSLFSSQNFDDSLSYLSLDTKDVGTSWDKEEGEGRGDRHVDPTMLLVKDVAWLSGRAFARTVKGNTARYKSMDRVLKTADPVMGKGMGGKRKDYPPLKKSVFYDERYNNGLKTRMAKTDEWREVGWEDVRHWNRENCGWTMSRERRFKPKLKNPKFRDVYHSETEGKRKAPTQFNLPEQPRPNSSYPSKGMSRSGSTLGGGSVSVGSITTASRSRKTSTKSRPHLRDKNLGPGDYDHGDLWETKEVCGLVPKSSMFASSSRRDLFDNDGFSRTRLGMAKGPLSPEKKQSEIEGGGTKRGEGGGGGDHGNSRVRHSRSAPVIGLDSARWDLNGTKFPKSLRSSIASQDSSQHNKKLYRVTRDIRTGERIVAPVKRDMITTPNVEDLKIAVESMRGGFPDEGAVTAGRAKLYTQGGATEGGRPVKVLKG